ncbi:DUF5681 domain-containing protein [Rhodovarius lipocyclicus]|uniref:DUF5681 domain-containing protein n=1 Tax=Rhodovarius lipocyclicus TaxID=268410 RepID=UPI00135C5A55|nr:DUF5681 domain-containing protein [Rhodovarius lipocyclicus]
MAKHRGPRRPTDAPRGYCKAPPEHQFKPGQSGNPKGRPRGRRSKSAEEIFLQLADKLVTVSDASGKKRIPMIEAIFSGLFASAAKGDRHARTLVLQQHHRLTSAQQAVSDNEERDITAEDEAILQNFLDRLPAEDRLLPSAPTDTPSEG